MALDVEKLHWAALLSMLGFRKELTWSVAAGIAYVQNVLLGELHPNFATLWRAKRPFSDPATARWQDTDRWGFDRELMVCYQSDVIMGSVKSKSIVFNTTQEKRSILLEFSCTTQEQLLSFCWKTDSDKAGSSCSPHSLIQPLVISVSTCHLFAILWFLSFS